MFKGSAETPKNIIKCLNSASLLIGSSSVFLPREDITGKITPNLIKNLGSSNRKVQLESRKYVNKILEEANKSIQPSVSNMTALVTHPYEIQSVVLRVTNISPQMTEEEFLNQLHRDYVLVLRNSWRQPPNSGVEALVELDNPGRAIALNQQILSENTKKSQKDKGTDLKVSIRDKKLCHNTSS